ncbi:MAG: hypothetical protein KDK90_29115, partial [Leptospiraceae bacterium]|nr:hypothetical protein [Leptospiraceae bacterium]
FGIDIQVGNIETEKRFDPIIGHIDFKIDIYAETTDHRFIIEIQRIDYDYNFDRFLHYFLMILADQQKTSAMYTPSQQVLGVVVTLSEMKKVESMKITEKLLKDEAREEGKKEGIEEGKKVWYRK